MSTDDLYDVSVLKATQAALQGMKGTADKVRRKEIIVKLAEDIRAARKRGCTWSEIAAMIGQSSGCEVSESTLRTYSRLKSAKRKTKLQSKPSSPRTSPAVKDQHGAVATTTPTDMTDGTTDRYTVRTDTPTPRA